MNWLFLSVRSFLCKRKELPRWSTPRPAQPPIGMLERCLLALVVIILLARLFHSAM